MLDCIKRTPSLLEAILDNNGVFQGLFDEYGDRLSRIDEVVLIGSGTSYTAGATARYGAEAAAGLRVTVATPNEFLYSLAARNPHALYVFISQTGTSIMTGEAVRYVKEQGFMTAAVSEAAGTPVVKEAGVFIDMGCGHEEYPMRTIGYSTTVLTLMLLGAALGKWRGVLSDTEHAHYVAQARAAAKHIPEVIDKTMAWLDSNRRSMLRAQGIFLSGSGALYGVALEGAVKIWETPQIISAGYELEEGLHGPNYGYNHNHCVIVLNDGGRDNDKAVALARYMKYEKHNGFIIGMGATDEQDLAFEPQGGCFSCLEFAAAVQTLAYRLAVEQGRDLFAPHDNSVMERYFVSHK